MDYEAVRHIMEDQAVKISPTHPTTPVEMTAPPVKKETDPPAASKSSQKPAEEKKTAPPLPQEPEPVNPPLVNERIPKALRDLMIENGVDEWDIQNVVAARGYFPADMEVCDYPKDFVDGVLVGAWQQVYAMIKEMKETDSLVFN